MKKGIQLFSVRDQYHDPDSLTRVLAALGEAGYDGVEFCGYADMRAEALRTALGRFGLKGVNAHVPYAAFLEDADREIDYAARAGLEAITIPFIPPEYRTAEGYRRLCGDIPRYRQKCRSAGISLCYHNHAFEFERQAGRLALEMLLEADPELLLELDSFWCAYAGYPAIPLLERYAGRVKYLHIKDYLDRDAQPKPVFCAIGSGKAENLPLLRRAGELGIQWVMVEQDNSRIDSLESARLSLLALEGYRI